MAGDWLLDTVWVTSGGRSWFFPFYRWVLAGATTEVLEGSAKLPQQVSNEREARARHPDLGAWVRDWQRRAYPEPPAERYRRELRDLMVAGLKFERLPASPPPTTSAASSRCVPAPTVSSGS